MLESKFEDLHPSPLSPVGLLTSEFVLFVSVVASLTPADELWMSSTATFILMTNFSRGNWPWLHPKRFVIGHH